MARLISNGTLGPEEKYMELYMRIYGMVGRVMQLTHLESGEVMMSSVYAEEINEAASALAGETIYGNAIIYRESEL